MNKYLIKILITIITIITILIIIIYYNNLKQKYTTTNRNPLLTGTPTDQNDPGFISTAVTGTTGKQCTGPRNPDPNGMYYFGNAGNCDYLVCNNGYYPNDKNECVFTSGVTCEGTDPNGYYTYDVNSICKLISCNINYAIDGSSCTVKQNTYGNSCGDNKFIDINGNCPNLLKAVTSPMYVANYLYGKQGTKGLLYTSSTPKGPWTSQSTTPDFVIRVSRTPTGFMGTGGDNNIYVSFVIAESGPWTKHPTLLATKNYYQVLSLINGGIAGLNTTKGPNGGYNMTLDGKVIEANKSFFSNQVFQLSDGTVGRLDEEKRANINIGHTSFADSWSTAIYPSKDKYIWILPIQDGSVYSVKYDKNLYYSKTGFRPPEGGVIGTGPVWEQLDTTKDYQYLF